MTETFSSCLKNASPMCVCVCAHLLYQAGCSRHPLKHPCADLSFDPYPQAHYSLITCPKAKSMQPALYRAQSLLSAILTHCVFSASLYCSTMRAILPHHHSPNKVLGLQLCIHNPPVYSLCSQVCVQAVEMGPKLPCFYREV